MRQNLTVQILIGLPGTGKTNYSMFLKQTSSRVSVITRDIIRCEVIWSSLYEGENKADNEAFEQHFEELVQKYKVPNLDLKVDKEERLDITRKLRKLNSRPSKTSLIILDGCHTKWDCLERLLKCIRKFINVYIEVMFFGDYDSECHHSTNFKPEGDYSDYNNACCHSSVPICVLQRKRDELKELMTNHMDEIEELSDNVVFMPNVIVCGAPR